jgi:hypothetical protein
MQQQQLAAQLAPLPPRDTPLSCSTAVQMKKLYAFVTSHKRNRHEGSDCRHEETPANLPDARRCYRCCAALPVYITSQMDFVVST